MVDPRDPEYGRFPLRSWLGFDLVATGDEVMAVLDVDERHLNPNGVVHGGVVFALVDTAMGSATMRVIDEGCLCASIEIHLRYLRPAGLGRLRAHTRVLRRGRRVVHLESRVTLVDPGADGGGPVDDRGAEIALATGSFAVLTSPPRGVSETGGR
ncbi:MAG: PaaI family thioesterase [Actinomyces sp.]|nr:MAG: PaaI family thioesterase [Actinomyces sp.]